MITTTDRQFLSEWFTRTTATDDLTCRADLTLRNSTINVEERSIEAVLATDRAVQVFDYRSFEFIEERLLMTGVDVPNQMPLLNNHLRYDVGDVFGSIRNIRVEGDKLIGRLHFAEGPADSPEERAWQKVRQGHLTDVSVGYRATNFVDIPAGKTQVVNGQRFTAGRRTLRVTTNWQPREASITPIGADAASKMRAAHGPVSRKDHDMPLSLRQYLESLGLRADATESEAWAMYRGLTGERKATADQHRGEFPVPDADPPADPPADPARNDDPPATPPAPAPEPQRNDPPADPPADPALAAREAAREAVQAERDRVQAIRQMAPDSIPADFIERAVNEGWSEGRASREFLEYVRNHRSAAVGRPGGPRPGEERERAQRGLAAGLMHMLGDSERVIDTEYQDGSGSRTLRLDEQDADIGDRYRSYTLLDMCREAIRMEGRQVPHSREEMIRVAVSTTALSNVFSTSIHARLLGAYTEAADTTDWCSEEDVANYQLNDRTQIGKDGQLEKLGVGGTAQHATLSDSVEQYRVARYAKQFVVDDMDIINDNLSGIDRMPIEMGLSAARLRPDLVYALLLANAALGADSIALFHASHNNLDSNALSLANIGAGVTSMGQQTQDSVRLNLRPRYLIVPGDLEFSAKEFLQSDFQLYGADDETLRGNKNVIKDLNLQLRVEGRIDATGVTDPDTKTAYTGSATNWFMFSPAGKTVVVGYLRGTGRRPSVRRFVLDKGQYGMGWDIQHSIGVKALDFRGCYKGNA